MAVVRDICVCAVMMLCGMCLACSSSPEETAPVKVKTFEGDTLTITDWNERVVLVFSAPNAVNCSHCFKEIRAVVQEINSEISEHGKRLHIALIFPDDPKSNNSVSGVTESNIKQLLAQDTAFYDFRISAGDGTFLFDKYKPDAYPVVLLCRSGKSRFLANRELFGKQDHNANLAKFAEFFNL